jgi:hypothetical protein
VPDSGARFAFSGLNIVDDKLRVDDGLNGHHHVGRTLLVTTLQKEHFALARAYLSSSI